MSRAEKFIQDCTRGCSNELDYVGTTCKVYQPWLTPDQARRAVEIAREEMIEKACKFVKEHFFSLRRIANECLKEKLLKKIKQLMI